MGLYDTLPQDLKEVDIIIAGGIFCSFRQPVQNLQIIGGTAGCIVASRLAAADSNLSILLIESGQNNFNNPKIVYPGMFFGNLMLGSTSAIFWQTEESKALAGRKLVIPSGGILGGGSSINFMMYTRAQAIDFDSWKTPGWAANDLLPYLQKLETYHGSGKPDTHGCDGPIHISDGGYSSKGLQQDFITAAGKVGLSDILDLQDLKSNNGVSRWLRYISPDGKRQDTAHRYLHALLNGGKHPNLHVLVETQVVRVLFDEQAKANGVEFCPNLTFHETTTSRVVRARKMVIVSAGACGTPLILERSGVGNPEILHQASIPLVADVPGVGHDYQDHNGVFVAYKTSLDLEGTQNALFGGLQTFEDAIKEGNPKMGWNTLDVGGKVRPDSSEVAALGPEFEAAWEKDFKEPSKPLGIIALSGGYPGDRSLAPGRECVQVASYNAYPYSRGSIHITGPSIVDVPRFDNGYFSDANNFDLKAHIWQYKKQREVMRRTSMYRGELAISHPKFSPASKAACLDLDIAQTLVVTEDIAYSPEDDKAIEQFLRENLTTTWHSLGTAKMAPRDELGVVDRFLNVYGVSGLKVIDLSIVPENVGANTNNTALMIGEKGADIIAGELGLRLV
ncbi:hypothetical protein VTL71DRAFT_15704 [Oculimacula yallundae]|uniref:Glucose-methanol-choline oxidoreductase N-terminal domain-containing protein n=1 Tax=Oculimacula yallundae TaxID=86028 RepID=A0ABR4CIQ6_9HELO